MKKKICQTGEGKKKKLDFSRKISFEPHLRVELAPIVCLSCLEDFPNFYCDGDACV